MSGQAKKIAEQAEECKRLLGEGKTIKAIAETLGVSTATVGRRLEAPGTPKGSRKAASSGSIITCFGAYWRREMVLWDSIPNLWGRRNARSEAVDHKDQRGIYLLHDHREVIYVGRAIKRSIGTRLGEHTANRLQGRWSRFSWFGFMPEQGEGKRTLDSRFTLGEVIAAVETILIEGMEPRQNRQAGTGKATEYQQIEDPQIREQQLALSGLVSLPNATQTP